MELSPPQLPFAAQEAPSGQPLTARILPMHMGLLKLRVGELRPNGSPVGDVLYLHGFADRLDNHGPLFEAWTTAGLRVTSFDLPSHGENSGIRNKIDLYSFDELTALNKHVERVTREEDRRPG